MENHEFYAEIKIGQHPRSIKVTVIARDQEEADEKAFHYLREILNDKNSDRVERADRKIREMYARPTQTRSQ